VTRQFNCQYTKNHRHIIGFVVNVAKKKQHFLIENSSCYKENVSLQYITIGDSKMKEMLLDQNYNIFWNNITPEICFF
jgi:hypothetical protein